MHVTDIEAVAAGLRAAFDSADLAAFGAVLDEHVRWGSEEDTAETCHTRAQVLERLENQRVAGMQTQVLEVTPGAEAVLAGFELSWPVAEGFARQRTVYWVMKVRDGHVVDIRGYGSRAEAAAQAGFVA
jgi:ketosteroid isomerase-like protein